MIQIYERFNNDQVTEPLKCYVKNKIERKYLDEILGIKKRMFFPLVKEFKSNPEEFLIGYSRKIDQLERYQKTYRKIFSGNW